MSANTPAQSRSETIKRLAGSANAVAALLAAIDLLPEAGKHDVLATCSSIANDVARDLVALVGGAQ